jgi:hypothetical protein
VGELLVADSQGIARGILAVILWLLAFAVVAGVFLLAAGSVLGPLWEALSKDPKWAGVMFLGAGAVGTLIAAAAQPSFGLALAIGAGVGLLGVWIAGASDWF